MARLAWLSRIALSCSVLFLASSASGQVFKPLRPIFQHKPAAQAPQQQAPQQQTPQPQTPPLLHPPLPLHLTVSQKAALLQSALHLRLPPVLDGPVVLGSSRPITPGLAAISFRGLMYETVDLGNPYGNDYAAFFDSIAPVAKSFLPGFTITMRVEQDHLYLIDCVMSGRYVNVTATIAPSLEAVNQGNTTPVMHTTLFPSTDKHAIFPTVSMPMSGVLVVDYSWDGSLASQGGPVGLYFCELTPFTATLY